MKKKLVKEEGGLKLRPDNRKSVALNIVQRHFPKVEKVIEAKQPLLIEVLPADGKVASRKNHEKCVMAQACQRAYGADGVIVARSIAYLIKGDLAVRFQIPPSVSREITAYDRGGSFEPGIYQLSVPTASNRLGRYRDNLNAKRKDKAGHTGKAAKKNMHYTDGIRAMLGSVEDKG